MKTEQALALASLIAIIAVLLKVLLSMRRRYQSIVTSHLLVEGLSMRPEGPHLIAIAGQHNGTDISRIVPAADLLYDTISHPQKRWSHWNPTIGPMGGMANDDDAPFFTVKLFRKEDEFWCRYLPRRDARRICDAIESLRTEANAPRTGNKKLHDIDFLWVDERAKPQ